MFLIYHGQNDYAIDEAVAELRQKVGTPDMLEANSHRFDAPDVRFDEVRAACESVPFLAEHRLVHVRGLLSMFEPDRRRGRSGAPERLIKEWSQMGEMADHMPPSTILVLTDGETTVRNLLLGKLRNHATVKVFPPLKGEALGRWIKEKAAELGTSITPGALGLLAQWVGHDQRVISNELQKLALYANGRSITEQDIRTLVPQAGEANIYAAVDALLEGRTAPGVQAIQRLRAGGTGFSEIAARLAEQLRRVMLAKEVLADGGKEAEVREKLNIQQGWIARRVVQQAQKIQQSRLEFLHVSLLDTDLAIKRGRLDEDLALDLLLSRFSIGTGPQRA